MLDRKVRAATVFTVMIPLHAAARAFAQYHRQADHDRGIAWQGQRAQYAGEGCNVSR